jgi:hypothetical protein
LGVMLGVRHAFEPDHLAAISVLTSEKKNPGFALGALWGLGHSLALLMTAGILLALGAQLPMQLQRLFELAVALVVVTLGVRAMHSALRGEVHSHASSTEFLVHVHGPEAAHLHVRSEVIVLRPLLMGMLHGLAGSGALYALVMMSSAQGIWQRLGAVLLFGLGSTLGMGTLTALAGRTLNASFTPRAQTRLHLLAGFISVLVGVELGWRQI